MVFRTDSSLTPNAMVIRKASDHHLQHADSSINSSAWHAWDIQWPHLSAHSRSTIHSALNITRPALMFCGQKTLHLCTS